MTIDFYIKKDKLSEYKSIIRSLSSARFNYNPITVGDKININITLDVEDGNKLSEILNKLKQL